MKVVQLGPGVLPIPPPGYGGIEQTIWSLHRSLLSAGVESEIINDLAPNQRWRLRERLRNVNADILHIHDTGTAFVAAIQKVPYVLSLHSPTWTLPEKARRWGRFLPTSEKLALSFSRGTIAYSAHQALRARRQAVVPFSGPLRWVRMGVDTDLFHTKGPGDPNIALGVGAIIPRKRWELAGCALRGTGVTLRLVGPYGDARTPAGYVDKVRASGPVELLGEVSQARLIKEYEQAGFLIHPSSGEAFAAVIQQALSCARPVITSDVIPLWRGKPGCWVYGGSYTEDRWFEQYVRAIATFFRDHNERRLASGALAREYMVKNWSWPVVIDDHVKFYKDILAANGGRPFLGESR